MLNQPVARLNLNGQSDSGELIGRFIPDGEQGWLFNEALVVTSMRQGYFLLLDELNLAEPQIVERLNSILEENPSLVLSEHDHSVIAEAHEHFRVFSTMNPVGEYAGRSAMSPAFRDRWQGFRCVPKPGEGEYHALARLAVFGEQPAITVLGQTYSGPCEPAVMGRLARVRGVDSFLSAFARFHAAVESAADPCGADAPRLGGERREPYVFSRRGFLKALRFIDLALCRTTSKKAAVTAAWWAIERYYLAKLADPAEREIVVELARAIGIEVGCWRVSP